MDTTYKAMAQLCAKREYCVSDIREKLFKRGCDAEEQQQILERLQAEGFIDEARFSKAYVHDKTLYDAWGFMKTKQALRAKGVAEDLIQSAIDEFPEVQYSEVLKRVVGSKQRTVKGKSDYETKQKLARSVIARGFEPQKVFKLLGSDDSYEDFED
jgi:regulatory protein